MGYRHVGWDVIVEDWEPEHDGTAVAEAVLEGIARCDGEAVVLLHSWPQATLEALPEIIRSVRARGGELSVGNKANNKTISQIRSAVERCISHLKNWKILATGYRGRLAELPVALRIVVALEFYRLGW